MESTKQVARVLKRLSVLISIKLCVQSAVKLIFYYNNLNIFINILFDFIGKSIGLPSTLNIKHVLLKMAISHKQ